MKYLSSKEYVNQSFEELCEFLSKHEYDIKNESEFCSLFFHTLLENNSKISNPVSALRTEISLQNKRIDIGIKSAPLSQYSYDVLIEAKIWIRPTNISHNHIGSSPSKKKELIVSDAERLINFVKSEFCSNAAILIFENGSNHLKNYICVEFDKKGLSFEAPIWIAIQRSSLGRKTEHAGLIWLKN